MLGQGLTLTIVGMVIVFLFLGILVLLMTVMSRIIRGSSARREAREAKAAEAPAYEEAEDLSEVAAALAMYVHRGGILPSMSGADSDEVAAALAAVAAAGGPVPRGNSREVAAAIAVAVSHKNIS